MNETLLPQGTILRYGAVSVARVARDIVLGGAGVSLLVGLNGEGKTTFLRWLCNLLPQTPPPVQRVKSIYLPESLEWPGNLSFRQIVTAVAPAVRDFQAWADALGLDAIKPYGLLSKGNRQKTRVLLTEALALEHGAGLICLDEPLSGLDYKTREIVWEGWRGGLGWRASHRVVSMHPSDIPYNPDQVIVASKGGISVMTIDGDVSWNKIRLLL